MFAQTQDLEFGQGQSRDVPDRELGPNSGSCRSSGHSSLKYDTALTVGYLWLSSHISHTYLAVLPLEA